MFPPCGFFAAGKNCGLISFTELKTLKRDRMLDINGQIRPRAILAFVLFPQLFFDNYSLLSLPQRAPTG
ncbi:hypothetical protein RvY_09851 [Ramazzottius varieornatus]|uniref:Uncharacterized protein n=1 Tax=Ramazzottius varieornatus TaxID=947166 RepID=A0A1D1VIK2_RAMVA|nr:hypothetical protein RvY_09851 [Ramazzottius varieornatus]